MTPLEIIESTLSPMGLPIEREWVLSRLKSKIKIGLVKVFSYGGIVVTVETNGNCHLYTKPGGNNFLWAMRSFLGEVWQGTGLTSLYAAVRDPKLASLLRRYGWVKTGVVSGDFVWYTIGKGDHA